MCMFILDNPFISELLYSTVNKNSYPVLDTPLVSGKVSNPLNSCIASELLNKINNPKIYTNSENSINWILSNLTGTNLPDMISLFKDKARFRELLKKIYPDFYFKKISYNELDKLNADEFKYPIVIKPSVGFLSFGVYTVYEKKELDIVVNKIKSEMEKVKETFPKEVLNSDNFIIEEFIKGDEYALDVYYDDNSNPVILNVFKHPFADKYDVSDRMYITSASIIKENYSGFYDLLKKIGEVSNLKNFPMHIELRLNNDKIIPIEVNPLRFAGWCTTDLAYYAYNINVYEYFMNNKIPDWNKIYNNDPSSVYAFVMAEVPLDVNKNDIISFDIESFKKDTNAEILNVREFDYSTKPMFCVLFIKQNNFDSIRHILKLDVKKYIKLKQEYAI